MAVFRLSVVADSTSVHAASLADRLSFRLSVFRISVVADSTSFHALSSSSVHALSGGG